MSLAFVVSLLVVIYVLKQKIVAWRYNYPPGKSDQMHYLKTGND